MSKRKKGISQITGLRGVAAFLIAYVLHWMLLFYAIPDFQNNAIETIFGASATFILHSPNIFFVLSGYLIHQSYNERIFSGEVTFSGFIISKIKKVYPLVVVTTLISWILQKTGLHIWGYYPLHDDGGQIRNSLLSLILSVLGLHSGYISDNDYRSVNGPAWFVAVLFLCYMLYYVITRLAKSKRWQNFLYVTFVALGIWIMYEKPDLPLLYTVNGRGYYCFFIGVMIKEYVNVVEDKEKILDVSRNFSRGFSMLAYVISLICLFFSLYTYCVTESDSEYKVFILALLCWPSLVYLVIHGYVLKWIFSIPCFVWLGKIAMPIFLCNFPTQLVIRMCDIGFKWNLDYSNPWLWGLHVLISLIVAIIFYFVFEMSRITNKY